MPFRPGHFRFKVGLWGFPREEFRGLAKDVGGIQQGRARPEFYHAAESASPRPNSGNLAVVHGATLPGGASPPNFKVVLV